MVRGKKAPRLRPQFFPHRAGWADLGQRPSYCRLCPHRRHQLTTLQNRHLDQPWLPTPHHHCLCLHRLATPHECRLPLPCLLTPHECRLPLPCLLTPHHRLLFLHRMPTLRQRHACPPSLRHPHKGHRRHLLHIRCCRLIRCCHHQHRLHNCMYGHHLLHPHCFLSGKWRLRRRRPKTLRSSRLSPCASGSCLASSLLLCCNSS